MDRNQVEDIAELKVRQYFDTYLKDVWPRQEKALRHHTHLMIEGHDAGKTAHGGVERRVDRAKWTLAGVALFFGLLGGVVVRVVAGLLVGG